jgi:hypothetical protein
MERFATVAVEELQKRVGPGDMALRPIPFSIWPGFARRTAESGAPRLSSGRETYSGVRVCDEK